MPLGNKLHTGIFLVCCLMPFWGWSQAVRIGVPPFPESFDIAVSDHPGAILLREAAGIRLFNIRPDRMPELVLAESLEIGRGGRVDLRIRRSARFSNGNEIGDSDVVFSLRSCTSAGLMKDASVSAGDDGRRLITIIPGGDMDAGNALEIIGKCIIYEEESSRLFGKDFGSGTNLVSGGAFAIRSFSANRSYDLVRNDIRQREKGPREVTVLAVSEPERGLSGVRSGDIDVFFAGIGKDDLTTRAEADDTLIVSRCGESTVVYRKGFSAECNGWTMLLSSMHYHR